ncbi:MAG: undecaprenyldiphospho-muramoylpentapeptide beta-N-acetylglucosaminyltransferase [Coxiella sp. RIFCSPHIGHO2_12_FULL_42_15]|nr:MAG: undecaprenyldiphospho-muramoylpentapeptide beta-N-acetylglucosaminyltransferase [Coxiella sp. RIFCSPHIGHO2_12_FULL_42_15]
MKRVLIIAGGTGGHIFPALAVADQLKQQGYEIFWLGARYGLEAKLVPDHYPIEFIVVQGMRKRGFRAKLLTPVRLLRSMIQAGAVIKRLNPQIVLAMGGYVAAPGGFAAWMLRRPLVIHEQNAKAGLTNRLLAKIATVRLQAFEQAFHASLAAETVGNPVRAEFFHLPQPEVRYAHRTGAIHVLILGGSQGARAINQCMIQVWQSLSPALLVKVWHQTGEADYSTMQEAYAELTIAATVEPFIKKVAHAYAWADIVICRAGAMTVSELAAAGVASVLIPYPHAVDNHQFYNAKYLCDPRAGVLIEQKELSARAILRLLEQFFRDRQSLLLMAQSARRLAQPEAAKKVAEICMRCIQNDRSNNGC